MGRASRGRALFPGLNWIARLTVLAAGWAAGLVISPLPSLAAETANESPPPPVVRPQSRQVLFNGTNLAGWHTWLVDTHRADPRRVFGVTNGWLRISGEGLGYLATEQAYADYRLLVEYKWGRTNWHWGDRIGRARDSGIFLHANGPDGNSHDGGGAFQAALECQVMQGAVGDLLLIRGTSADGSLLAPRVRVECRSQVDRDGWPWWQEGGQARWIERWGRVNSVTKSAGWKDELDFRGQADAESPAEEWTRVECLARAGTLTIFVNGRRVNEAREVFPRSGRILLQCEGSEIFYRRVELRPAEPALP